MRKNKLNILFTGLNGSDSSLQALKNSGRINFIHFPTIEITPAQLSIDDINKIQKANSYDYIIFTSVNSVKYFTQIYSKDLSTLNCSTRIVAIGKRTASLLIEKNIDVDLIPQNSSSESINKLLTKNLVERKSILIPGSKLSRTNLFKSLEAKGASVDFVPIYENKVPSDVNNTIEKEKLDLIIFTSPSAFYNFISIFEIKNLEEYFSGRTIAAIGSVTKEAIEKKNLTVKIMPEKFNLESLSNEIKKYYKIY